MNFKIKKTILLESLNHVEGAISTKNIIPALSGIKIELNNKGLSFICSNDDITINSTIDKRRIEEYSMDGSIIVPGKYFIEIIRKIPHDFIDIKTDGLKIMITTPTSNYNLNGMNASEYPHYSLELSKNPVYLNKKELKQIVNQTSFAVSTQEARPILTGINFTIENGQLEVVATDSYRLAKKIIQLNNKDERKISIVIPGSNLYKLIKIINDEDSDIEIHLMNNTVLFSFDNIVFQSRILNGTFPNTSNLIPNHFEHKIQVNISELYNMIDRASLLSDREKNAVKLSTKHHELIIRSNAAELGKVEERMKIKNESKEDIEISFNPKYMMEALKSFSKEDGYLCMNSDTTPIILKEKENDSLVQLIVPIKTF